MLLELPARTFFVLISALPAFCQGFHLGVKGGIPITQYFETGTTADRNESATYSAATRRYTIGVSGEGRFTNSLGFEVDAMYHRMGYVGIVNDFFSGNFQNSAIDVKGNSWDFPVLA